jgi:dTMP kinase
MPEGDTDWSRLAGRFVVLDGGEGCGKSTQLARLATRLRQHDLRVTAVRDPGSTPIGERVRGVLLDPEAGAGMAMRCEMLLYMAARAQLVDEVIRPALDAGGVVLADRFVSSTLAYQLGGGGLTADEIRNVARVATAGTMPDLTVILDLPTEVAQERVVPQHVSLFADATVAADRDRIEQRPDAYHRSVRENFLRQARDEPGSYAIVDAGGDADLVEASVLAAVSRLVTA